MKVEAAPLLGILRELWSMPRDMARFQAYVARVTQGPDGAVLAPLVAANPMAREHMVAYLDALAELGADALLADACAEAERRLAASSLGTRLSVIPVDDLGGAWSDRTMVDFDARSFARGPRRPEERHRYATALVYASETPTRALLRERLLAAAYRAAYAHRHGVPKTLGDLLRQEGSAMRFAGATGPFVPDIAAVRAVLAPHQEATLHATRFAALYGDAEAKRIGHRPLGLPEDAGLAVALADAMQAAEVPESLV